MQSLIENLGGPSAVSRRKLGGMLKQAIATVESRLEEAAQDMGKMISSNAITPADASHDLPMILSSPTPSSSCTVEIETEDFAVHDNLPLDKVQSTDRLVLELEEKARDKIQTLLISIADLQRENEQLNRQMMRWEKLMTEQRKVWSRQKEELLEDSKKARDERDQLQDQLREQKEATHVLELQWDEIRQLLASSEEERDTWKTRVECMKTELAKALTSKAERGLEEEVGTNVNNDHTTSLAAQPMSLLESTYWEQQRNHLLSRISELERENERLRALTIPGDGVDAIALETIAEQQEQIELLTADVNELRILYHKQLQELNTMFRAGNR